RKKNWQEKKEELENEVTRLQKTLDHEEMVHQVLEQAVGKPDCSALHIPTFLPPRMKELLAELTMVEHEIKRLEKEKNYLEHGLSYEQEASKEAKTKQLQQVSNTNDQFSTPPNPKPATKEVHKRAAFDTKSLYFINKAIKGDYTIYDFTSTENSEKSRKENHNNEEAGFEEKVSRKSGSHKPSSPSLLPRHSTTKFPQSLELDVETFFDLSLTTTSNSNSSEQNISKLQPNKLSESIMKCLILIFVRLLRTSRATELEKWGNISRTALSISSSRSFRVADIGLNSKTGISSQKDSRQQDPYGVFEIEDSLTRDIGPYKNLVKFTSSSLDPRSMANLSFTPLLRKLRILLNKLQNVELRFLTHKEKLAFWINTYNACIMHGFLQYGVPSNPENMTDLISKATLKIGGNKIHATTIEHFILRQPLSSKLKDVNRKNGDYEKEGQFSSNYRLDLPEPNVMFALCCGNRSSPAVRIYTANGISTELEKSKLDYLQASIVVTITKKLMFPELLLRDEVGFAGKKDSLVEWVCHQLPTSGSLRKSIVDCFKGHNNGKISHIVEEIPYDFDFHYLLAI
ncbi:hypothetical protein GIB67_027568, partial [Kingdonia uniflora]